MSDLPTKKPIEPELSLHERVKAAASMDEGSHESYDAIPIGRRQLVDSVGLELLLWLVDELSERRGQLRLVNPDEVITKILEITRLERRFNTHESIESAAKSLR